MADLTAGRIGTASLLNRLYELERVQQLKARILLVFEIPDSLRLDRSNHRDRYVELGAVYTLPTPHYLRLQSYWDEFEDLAEPDTRVGVDLMALEVEKAARLILKGHRRTLQWLTAQADFCTPWGEQLICLARERSAQPIGPGTQRADAGPTLYRALDELVAGARAEAALDLSP